MTEKRLTKAKKGESDGGREGEKYKSHSLFFFPPFSLHILSLSPLVYLRIMCFLSLHLSSLLLANLNHFCHQWVWALLCFAICCLQDFHANTFPVYHSISAKYDLKTFLLFIFVNLKQFLSFLPRPTHVYFNLQIYKTGTILLSI